MPRVRLGGVLLIPEPARTEIDALRRSLADGSRDRVPAHVTLVPPVNVNTRDLDAVYSRLRDAAATSPPFRLRLGPPKTFLPENPVLYLEAGGDLETLETLRHALLQPPLARRLSWPYVPHVTLCDEGDPERLEQAAEALRDYRVEVSFEQVHLLKEDERVWRPFADARLGGRRVVGRGGLELEITESAELDTSTAVWLADQWRRFNQARQQSWAQEPFVLTARREGAVVGVATGWTNEGVAYLSELMVDPDVRGEGIGGHLMGAFEDFARRRKCARLALRTDEGGDAPEFYESRGWREEARLEDWVGGRTAIHYRKDL